MIELQLFRLRVVVPDQATFLYEDQSPSALIQEALSERPSKELRRGHHWHIGNVQSLDPTALRFAIGRTTSSILERYDETSGNFIEEHLDAAPYTVALLDLRLQVIAIAKKARLMPTIEGIGRKLLSLLEETAVAKEAGFGFELLALGDPTDFISYLHSAYAVRSFSLGFHRPNPWDADRDFHRPMELLLGEAQGNKGKTKIEGEALSSEILEQLTRSAAAAGDDAEARVQLHEGLPTTRKSLSSTSVTLQVDSMATEADFLEVLDRLRTLYENVRGKTE